MGNKINLESGQKLCKYADSGDLDGVKTMLTYNPRLLDCVRNGGTPLYWTTIRGHVVILKYLIECGANINVICKNDTPLMIAAYHGRVQCVEVLLEAGADCTLKNQHGQTASDIAERRKQFEIVRLLRESMRRNAQISDRPSIEEYVVVGDDDVGRVQQCSYRVPYAQYMVNSTSGDSVVSDYSMTIGNTGDVRTFDDGTEFVVGEMIGKGASTFAMMITVDRKPKVLKISQNDESQRHVVLDGKTLVSGQDVRPFGGSTRREDFDNYLKSMDITNHDTTSLSEWLEALDKSFAEYDVKRIDGLPFSLTRLHDMEDRVKYKKRDLVRFLYWYHLFQAMEIAHCDVAARNVIITFEGPMVIDFGCTVKFDEANFNKLPLDVTPAYYLTRRGAVRSNHDLKGFYLTACSYFDVVRSESMVAKLDERNVLELMDVFAMSDLQ